MKKLKLGIAALLVGQTLTLLYKDKSLKEKMKNKDGFEKIKVVFNGLIDLNKSIFFDVKNYDYEGKFNEVKAIVDLERKALEDKVEDLKKQAKKLNEDQIQPLIAEYESKANELITYANESITDLNEKYDLETKIRDVLVKVDEIKAKYVKKAK